MAVVAVILFINSLSKDYLYPDDHAKTNNRKDHFTNVVTSYSFSVGDTVYILIKEVSQEQINQINNYKCKGFFNFFNRFYLHFFCLSLLLYYESHWSLLFVFFFFFVHSSNPTYAQSHFSSSIFHLFSAPTINSSIQLQHHTEHTYVT